MSNLLHKFAFFGCWNNLNTKMKKGKAKSLGDLKNTMAKLKSFLHTNDYNNNDCVIVAGDCYYPSKKKKGVDPFEVKYKEIFDDKLEKGFELLRNATTPTNTPVHMIFGNHDLETNTGKTPKKQTLFLGDIGNEGDGDPDFDNKTFKQRLINEGKLEGNCRILDLEENVFSQNIRIFNQLHLEDDTLLLMLDTSMYEKDAAVYLPCYEAFFRKYGRHLYIPFDFPQFTIPNLKDYQNRCIEKAIQQYISKGRPVKNLIIAGHHPMICIKTKKLLDEETGEEPLVSQLSTDIHSFNPTLIHIVSRLRNDELLPSNPNVTYLCADLHLFQSGDIHFQTQDIHIQQYIVGTGGTELDDPIQPQNIHEWLQTPTKFSENATYTLHNEQHSNGFIEYKINTDLSHQITFIPTEDTPVDVSRTPMSHITSSTIPTGLGLQRRKHRSRTRTRTRKNHKRRSYSYFPKQKNKYKTKRRHRRYKR